MSTFTKEFYLEQHSPIIHFQHDHKGSTLRASELRPRLDRHIARSKGGWDRIPKAWLVGKGATGHKALDYRVTITPLGERYEENLNEKQARNGKWNAQYPGYFANMGRESQEDIIRMCWYPQVKVTFTCLHPELLELVGQSFPQFLSYTNFGTRKSKGFGSYWLIDQYLEDVVPKETPYLYIQKSEFRDVADGIDYYYKRLKSGVNYSHNRKTGRCDGHYEKSFLYKYLDQHKNYSWEKRWLKENFFCLPPKQETKRYARAFLGMAGSITFRQTQEPCNPESPKVSIGRGDEKDIEIAHAATVIEKKKGEVIARIPSPITFRPVRCGDSAYKVFILVDPTHQMEQVKGKKEFTFKYRSESYTLSTPSELIDYADLLRAYHDELGDAFHAVFFGGRSLPISIHHT